jgi:hypothetical protein
VRALDMADNIQDQFGVDVSSMLITMDKAAPVTSVTLPVDDGNGIDGRYKPSEIGYYTGDKQIKGTVVDNLSADYSGVEKVQMTLSYLLGGDTWYWLGAVFSSGTYAEANAWLNTSIGGAAPTWTWDYMVNITWPSADTEYKLELKAMDYARLSDDSGEGNWEQSPYVTKRFIVDNTPPVVAITSPTAPALNAMSGVWGTVDASSAGHHQTEIRVSTGSGGNTRYWDGSVWQTSENTWNVIGSQFIYPTSWYYTVGQAMLKDDVVYTVSARSLDYAGNYSAVYSTYVVTYDTTAPHVQVTYPADGGVYSQIKLSTPVTGSSDQNNQSSAYTGVSTVAVQIVRDPAGSSPACFDGGGFSACPVWLSAQGAVEGWNFNSGNLALSNTTQYRIDARATDIAGNVSAVNSVTMVYDVEKPTSTVVYPLPGYTTGFALISGTASDERYGARLYNAKL